MLVVIASARSCKFHTDVGGERKCTRRGAILNRARAHSDALVSSYIAHKFLIVSIFASASRCDIESFEEDNVVHIGIRESN